MRRTWTGLFYLVLAVAPVPGAEPAPLAKIDRTIVKEPRYVATPPLYGLLAFGPAAQQRVWLILDKSKPDAPAYDILYADLNANGDLTEPAKRLVGQREGADVRFQLPDLKDPVTGATHTQFTVRMAGAGQRQGVMVSLKWRGGWKMGGGYPEDPENGYMNFAPRPAAAPVLWADGDGPFRFQRWYSGKLSIGAADNLAVFVGQPGAGPSSFWAFQEHFLPEGEWVQATLVYHDAQGQEHQAVSPLKLRC